MEDSDVTGYAAAANQLILLFVFTIGFYPVMFISSRVAAQLCGGGDEEGKERRTQRVAPGLCGGEEAAADVELGEGGEKSVTSGMSTTRRKKKKKKRKRRARRKKTTTQASDKSDARERTTALFR